jgi:hypothetical protein
MLAPPVLVTIIQGAFLYAPCSTYQFLLYTSVQIRYLVHSIKRIEYDSIIEKNGGHFYIDRN